MNPENNSSSADADVTPSGSGGSLTRNVGVNLARYGALLAVGFVLLPVIIHRLGVQRYGFWALASEVTGYFIYLDLGIRNAVGYYIALYAAQRSGRDLNETAATAFWASVTTGTVLTVAGFGLAQIFPFLFHITGDNIPEVRYAVILLSAAAGIGLPVELLNAVLNGYRRIDIAGTIDALSRSGAAIAMLAALMMGGGLFALGMIQLISRLAALIAAWLAVRRVMTDLSLSLPRHVRLHSFRRLIGYGVPTTMINLCSLAISRTDLILIGMLLGVRAAALYSIPRSVLEYANTGVQSLVNAFGAHFTHLHGERRTADLIELFRKGARIAGVGVFLLTAWMAAFGHDFLALWQGPAFVSGPWTSRADVALLILVAAFLPRMLAGITGQLFLATGLLSFLVRVTALEAIVKVGLSFWLIRSLELAGAAIANLIPIAVFEGFAIAGYLFRSFPISPGRLLSEWLARPAMVGVLAWAASYMLIRFREPVTWPLFLAEASAAAIFGMVAAYLWGISADERETIGRIVRASTLRAGQ